MLLVIPTERRKDFQIYSEFDENFISFQGVKLVPSKCCLTEKLQ